jgi:hypothetical protein
VTATTRRVDSGLIAPGRTFTLAVTESLDYFCTIHPSMKIKVLLAG